MTLAESERVRGMSQPQSNLSILQGQAFALFAFDIGYEVDLEKLGSLLPSQRLQPLSTTKRTPTYLQYPRPPHVIRIGETLMLPNRKGQIQATIFDFGAVSITYRWPLVNDHETLTLESLPAFSEALFESDLENDARAQIQALLAKIRPAVSRPALAEMVEDYYVFALEKLASPLSAQELRNEYDAILAQVLRFETQPLSRELQKEALAKAISYYPSDLALIDWNAAVLYDPDYTDTLSVLELLNVELLEARYLDAELDDRIQVYEDVVQKQPRWFIPLLSPYRHIIQELAELRIESALLAERVDNALKLIGDLYLARVHDAASERFGIAAWDAAISRKLDITGNLYQLLTDRISNAQGQTLELIIIILILIEIFFK
jgi:hypothetical protein